MKEYVVKNCLLSRYKTALVKLVFPSDAYSIRVGRMLTVSKTVHTILIHGENINNW